MNHGTRCCRVEALEARQLLSAAAAAARVESSPEKTGVFAGPAERGGIHIGLTLSKRYGGSRSR